MKIIFLIENLILGFYILYKLFKKLNPIVLRWYYGNFKIYWQDRNLNFKVYGNFCTLNNNKYNRLRFLSYEDNVLYLKEREQLVSMLNKEGNIELAEIKVITTINFNDNTLGVYLLFKNQFDYLRFPINKKYNLTELNDIKVEWKIPNSKLSSFNCDWTKGSINPFPFILRKTHYSNGYYIVEAIIFNNLETARYQCYRVYELKEKNTSLRYPYSDWDIIKENNNEVVDITTDEILKALDRGFEWIHIDETAEWYMDVYVDSLQPCWLK